MNDNAITAEASNADLLAELSIACKQRAAVYGMLSRLFRVEIDETFLIELKQMRFPTDTGNDMIDAGYRKIANYLGEYHENTLLDLAIDYTRAFIGNGMNSRAAAYPFESVYTSEKRLLMQEARDEVLAIYREAGLGKQDSWHDAEDHIALELEYLQVMTNRAADALNVGDDEKARELLVKTEEFLRVHLGIWYRLFTEETRGFAQTDFYLGAVDLLDGFLETEREFFDEVLTDEGGEDEPTDE